MSTNNPNDIPTNQSNGLTTIETNPTLMSENAPAIIASTFPKGSVRVVDFPGERPSSGRPSSGKRLSRNAVAPMEDPEAGQSPPPPPPYSEPAAPSRQAANGDSPAEENRTAAVLQSTAAGKGDEEPSDKRTCHSFRVFGFPLPVFFILGNEFCERFSYYGMKAILVMYFTAQGGDGLSLDDDSATVYYHAFSMLVYFTPLLGGIIADTWLGKFWTIVSLSLVYAAGNIVMSLTSLPGQTLAAGAIIGLLLISLGSGGIKPCVSSFGADQFGSSEGDKKASSRFFSIFYFAINVGSLLSIFITPILRTKVHCFGSTTSCYPLAFGVPAALMLAAIVLFLIGTTCYKRNPPQGNVIVKVFGCIIRAFVNYFKGRPGKKEGFLNRASDTYDEQFIDDVRTVLRVLLFFLPVPVFWALFDQQGSRWTLQAKKMDLAFMQADQVQIINPAIVLILIPLFETVIYPLLGKCNLLTSKRLPHRMVVGGVFAVVAFVIAGFVQLAIEPTQPKDVEDGKIRILTGNFVPDHWLYYKDESETVNFLGTIDKEVNAKIAKLQFQLAIPGASQFTPITINIDKIGELFGGGLNLDPNMNVSLTINLPEEGISGSETYRLVISRSCSPKCRLYAKIFKVITKKADDGNTYVRFVSLHKNTEDTGTNFTIEMLKAGSNDIVTSGSFHLSGGPLASSDSPAIERGQHNFKLKKGETELAFYSQPYEILNGAGLTLVLSGTEKQLDVYSLEDMQANTVTIFLQFPQYVLITLGEILFSIAGLEFAYQQAPASMKSFLTACWLLTVAFGNLIMMIIAEIRIPNQAIEFFAFAALMSVDIIVLGVLAYFFKYREEEPEAAADEKKTLDEKPALEMSPVHPSAPQNGANTGVVVMNDRDEQL